VSAQPTAMPAPLSIVYRDADLVAVSKPAGLLVHRSAIDRGARDAAVQILRDMLGRHVYPVHRLDRPTSGLLLFALSPDIHSQLTTAFARREVGKKYLALVRGWPPPAGVIDYPLRRIAADGSRLSEGIADEAQTEYRCLGQVELPVRVDRYPATRYALLSLSPSTGRRHQLRRHLAHLAHPVVGDTTYGQATHNRLFRQRYHSHRLLLAAVALEFAHPASGIPQRLCAPLATEFWDVLAAIGLDAAVPVSYRPAHAEHSLAGPAPL